MHKQIQFNRMLLVYIHDAHTHTYFIHIMEKKKIEREKRMQFSILKAWHQAPWMIVFQQTTIIKIKNEKKWKVKRE